jgi:acyl carrier protein
MPDERIIRRLRALLAYHSGAPEASLNAESTPQNTGGWDSLANLNLMAALEQEFCITIETDDLMKMRSLGEIEAYLNAYSSGDRAG